MPSPKFLGRANGPLRPVASSLEHEPFCVGLENTWPVRDPKNTRPRCMFSGTCRFGRQATSGRRPTTAVPCLTPSCLAVPRTTPQPCRSSPCPAICPSPPQRCLLKRPTAAPPPRASDRCRPLAQPTATRPRPTSTASRPTAATLSRGRQTSATHAQADHQHLRASRLTVSPFARFTQHTSRRHVAQPCAPPTHPPSHCCRVPNGRAWPPRCCMPPLVPTLDTTFIRILVSNLFCPKIDSKNFVTIL